MNILYKKLLATLFFSIALLKAHALTQENTDELFKKQTAWCTRLALNSTFEKIESTYFLFVENASLFVCYSYNEIGQIDTQKIVLKSDFDAPNSLKNFTAIFKKQKNLESK